ASPRRRRRWPSCTPSARSAKVSPGWPPAQAGTEAMEPQDSRSPGLFFCGPKPEGAAVAAEETKHYLANGAATTPDAREALEWARETTAKMVDLKFCDLLGTWQHMTLPISAFDESAFDEGLGFDGSSIRGWQGISESDMLLMPDASSAILDPFTEAPTLSL